jgi:hypothetical protein
MESVFMVEGSRFGRRAGPVRTLTVAACPHVRPFDGNASAAKSVLKKTKKAGDLTDVKARARHVPI